MTDPGSSSSGACSSRANLPKIEIDSRCLKLIKTQQQEIKTLRESLSELQTRYDLLRNQESLEQVNENAQSVSVNTKVTQELVKKNLELQQQLNETETEQQNRFDLENLKQMVEKYREQLQMKDREIALLRENKSKDAVDKNKMICRYESSLRKCKASCDALNETIEQQQQELKNSKLKEANDGIKPTTSIQPQQSEEEEDYVPAVPIECQTTVEIETLRKKLQTLQLQYDNVQVQNRSLLNNDKLLKSKLCKKEEELATNKKLTEKTRSQLHEEIESLHKQINQLKTEKDNEFKAYLLQSKTFEDDFNEERQEKQKAVEELQKYRSHRNNQPGNFYSTSPPQHHHSQHQQEYFQQPPQNQGYPPRRYADTHAQPRPSYPVKSSQPSSTFPQTHQRNTTPYQGEIQRPHANQTRPRLHIGFTDNNMQTYQQNPTSQQTNRALQTAPVQSSQSQGPSFRHSRSMQDSHSSNSQHGPADPTN